MSRRMSVSMTLDAVRNRTKTVTRRHPTTWRTLKPGDRLTLIEKGMGLPKGAKQVVVAEVEIASVRVEALGLALIEVGATETEGLPRMSASEFVLFWLKGHKHKATDDPWDVECRRIEWVYLDAEATS